MMMDVENELHQLSINDFCEFILEKFGTMCYSKLQKLSFYCDAYHLAYFEQMLLHEPFQAWEHGPVCADNLELFGGEKILFSDVSFRPLNETDYRSEINKLTQKQIELINDVLSVLVAWTDSELETSVHRELPYINATKTGHRIINKVETMIFYKSELN